MNNYEFWEKYNKFIKGEIGRLCRTKKELYIDLHIHSNYSADGKQNLKQILETTKEKGFDIIAITDHDSLNVYDELYDIVSKGVTSPIIIPGIEFTTDKREYGNQCHMLQLFVNPKDLVILKDVSKNYNSMFNRSKIQFNRLKENITIKEIIKKHNIHISYKDYESYLKKNEYIPEYDTLSFYLIEKFKEKRVTTFDILDLLEKSNEKMEDIKYIIPHQSNLKIMNGIANRLKIDKEKMYVNIDKVGNTFCASIPIAIDELKKEKLLKSGDKIILLGYGGGLNTGSILLEI